MEYVKNLLSEEINKHLRSLEKSNKTASQDESFKPRNAIHKKNINPILKQLIFVSRLIMSMSDIEAYLMPYTEFCELEKSLKPY